MAGLVLAGLLLFLSIDFAPGLERFNHSITDFQISLLPKTSLSPLPVIVEVDEKSLAAYGQWPWPRYQLTKLLGAINQAGAAAIAIDALFIEPDRTSPAAVQKELMQNFNHTFLTSSPPQILPDYDAIFSQSLSSGPFVLSYLFGFNSTNVNPCLPQAALGKWLLAKPDAAAKPQLFNADSISCNISTVQKGAHWAGFINSAPDEDGLYRRTPLIIQYQQNLYPSLALQAYLTATGQDHFAIRQEESGLVLELASSSVPLDNAGNLLIKLPDGQQKFKKISAADVLSGSNLSISFKDGIVFIGFSAAGLHELRPTPYDPQFLGVDLHATIIDNLDRQDFLHKPDGAFWLEVISGILLTLALSIILTNVQPVIFIALPFLIIIFLAAVSQAVLSSTGIVLSPAIPVAMCVITLLTLALLNFRREYLRAGKMTKLVAVTQEGIIESFCSMSEYRDPETGAHIKRTQHYIKALAEHLKHHPKFKSFLQPEVIELFFKAAPLHDIGKIGIRDHILLKPDHLAEDEFAIMKSHPVIGAEIIKSVAEQIGWNPFMEIAHEISLCHQEKWDGSGYPAGLAGEAIPLSARFMALADVYDALISKRVYKQAFCHKTAVNIIGQSGGTHFDPLLVQAFLEIHERFRDIALQFLDNEEQRMTLFKASDELASC